MGIKKTIVMHEGVATGVKFERFIGAGDAVDSFYVYREDLSESITHLATCHGLSQKIGDAGALSKGATDSEKFAAMREVRDQITGSDGEWNKRAEGAGTMLVRAVAEWSGQSVADVKAQLAGKDAAFLKAIAAVPEVKAILDRMAAERPVAETAKTAAAEFLAGLKAA